MTTLGLIGSGHIGSTLARLAVAAGHDVVLSNSRGPETLQDLVDDLGPHARAATADEAAKAGDLVVVTVPLVAVDQVPAPCSPGRSSSTPPTTTPSATGGSRSWTTGP
ncbi:MAG: NAD(P)-binding domain-containing protein [Nocardioides sp.]